jgi:hypothetical protein
MRPRHNRRQRAEERAGAASRAHERVEEAADGEWHVRRVTGSAAGKTYRCPGCDQAIAGSIAHVVAWPADRPEGAEHRRHWHTPCWAARANRAANLQRGRSAPRFG